VIRASVIVPARDAEATLPRTLAALADQEGAPSFEVVVADDHSRDATAQIARRAGVRVLALDGERGPAAARNAAVAASSGALLAFCDADCYPTPGWLAAGARALTEAELVQGRVEPDPRAPRGPFDRTLWVVEESGLYETANLFATRALFDRLGGFEDWLSPRSGKGMAEDVWFGWRARRSGARSAFCREALAHHAVFPRGGRDYVAERRRLRHFPEMTAKMPELRSSLLHRRVFLNRRTMKLDLAVAGALAAALLRSPLPLAAAAPYARELRGHARDRAGAGWARVAAVDAAADLVGATALLRGSLAARTPVL
jgi:glycosyltransferase involved in cell wall biosynthesis